MVKPVSEGSSVGVHIVTEQSNGPAAIILEQRELVRT
jgi:D-alanine-D-alanine ligase-like ATP-grasp enzyme